VNTFCTNARASDNLKPMANKGLLMLVKFLSSETGELLMFAEVAGSLLRAIGKECTARGTFTREQMMPAAKLLREAVARGEGEVTRDEDSTGEKPVAMRSRAFPLIDMLERSSQGGAKANIVWEAAAPF
jgi:hypothetical protein